MAKCYFELRKQSARGSDSIAADMMRHLHTRQHLGKAMIVCGHPNVMLSAARKQWLKLCRALQKQRASTLNADKILKYTHTITHMQQMRFSAKNPLDDPEAEVYFATIDQLSVAPLQCFSMYVTVALPPATASALIEQLPADTLLVDYAQATPWLELGLQPKYLLEGQVQSEWGQMKQFLTSYHIDVTRLLKGNIYDVEAMDNALDTLLGVSHKFLQYASAFQRALELARPLRTNRAQREQYDALSLLAHRVQALTSNAFTQRFLETYNEDDTFFLFDHRKHTHADKISTAIKRHQHAGRTRLATALQHVYIGRSLKPIR